MFFGKKAQGATEYLLIIGAVMVLAVIVIGIYISTGSGITKESGEKTALSTCLASNCDGEVTVGENVYDCCTDFEDSCLQLNTGACQPAGFCGDGQCILPEDVSSCPQDCETPLECGNGIPETGEECDDGILGDEPFPDLNDDGACVIDEGVWECKNNVCQDGYLNSQTEDCDFGPDIPGDGCDEFCQIEEGVGVCGDGTIQNPNGDGILEECDDLGTTPGDGCNDLCQIEDDHPDGPWDCRGEPSDCAVALSSCFSGFDSDTKYRLIQDVSITGNCMNIDSLNGVNLDCMTPDGDRYKATATGNGSGVVISNSPNVTIRNCIVENGSQSPGSAAFIITGANTIGTLVENVSALNAGLASVIQVTSGATATSLIDSDVCSDETKNILINVLGQTSGTGMSCGIDQCGGTGAPANNICIEDGVGDPGVNDCDLQCP